MNWNHLSMAMSWKLWQSCSGNIVKITTRERKLSLLSPWVENSVARWRKICCRLNFQALWIHHQVFSSLVSGVRYPFETLPNYSLWGNTVNSGDGSTLSIGQITSMCSRQTYHLTKEPRDISCYRERTWPRRQGYCWRLCMWISTMSGEFAWIGKN